LVTNIRIKKHTSLIYDAAMFRVFSNMKNNNNSNKLIVTVMEDIKEKVF